MRVLTVRQPWAWAIFHGKSIENRPRVWSYTGPVAIHSGAQWDLAALDDRVLRYAMRTAGLDPERVRAGLEGHHFPASAVIGVVDLIGAHRSDIGCCPGNPWARWPEHDNPAGYIGHHALRNPRALAYPIPASGKLGLWRPGELLADEIETALMEAGAER